jgi:hypothetical protein
VPVSIWGARDADQLRRDRDEGVERVIIQLETAKTDAVLPVLDRWAKIIPTVA